MKDDLITLREKVRSALDLSRYEHTLGVEYTAAALAMCHGANVRNAQIAGLLHDCAKCIPHSEKIAFCEEKGLAISQVEREKPDLLHAKVGAYIAAEKYHVNDPEILAAIRSHTTGRPGMSVLEQIVFIADYIEPLRNKSKHLPEIRRTAFRDLDECCYMILKDMLLYLNSRSAQIDPTSSEAFHFYEEVHEERRD